MLGRADCSECMWVHFLRVFQGMATHGRSRSAGGSAPHGEERRWTTSLPARETSRGGGGGEEERRAQNLWCDYSKRVWCLDRASQDGSSPLQPPCGPLLFVAVRADRTRLAGSIVQWVDVGEYNFKFTLKKHYKSDGSVDDIAKGCKVAGRMFGGGAEGRRLAIHPEIILAIPDWEDVYNHRSLDEFLVDTIALAIIDCYERKDMRYTKPIFVLAPIIAPPENGEPVVRVLPADFNNSQPEKYWYYPVCGQHNARAAMKVKDHPVFEYYNFCKWPFRPIYFPDDDFDGYAHVSCEDNMKDKKNPPCLQVLSMRDIRNIWKIKGKPRVVLDNASKKKDEVRKWVQFMALAMKKTPYTRLWNLSTEENKRKQWAEKLRYYLPLAMADDSVFALGEKFYEEWSKGKLLASDGRRWTEKPPTYEEVAKPGLSTVTDSQGLKKHIWYVKVDDPSLKKGKGKPKKAAEEKTFYVQVPEPDVHCWKELVDLTDREKKRLLNGVLNLNVVWVQTKFEYEEMDKREWNANSTFIRSKKQLFEEFKDKGLDGKLWNESRKFFTDFLYVNKCPQFLGCQHDNNIKRTAALINDQHFPVEWKRVVLSVITGDRAKGKKSPRGVDECINIMWTRTSALTTLAQFNVDALSAIDHKEALGKLGHQLRSHTCVLILCGTVDRAQWDSGAFASLSELLGFVCQDYWTLVVFVPCLWNLSFMTSLSALGATRCYTGKWVRKTAAKKTHQFGNNIWEKPDVMHILFKGEDPRLLTHLVYEEAVAEDDDAALHKKQKVTPTDVEEKSFKSLTFTDIGNLTQRGALYKDGERNPNQLCNQLLFFCGVADAVLFLGKPHAQVVWSLLQQGRHVLAVDGDTMHLEYTVQYVTHEPVYDPNKDMFFKFTPKKRRQVYSFLYSEQPRLRFDPQYVVRKEVAIAVLQGYHGASWADAVSFIKRLEYVFFNENVVDPPDFTLDNYKLAFGEEDDFNIETEQEESVEDDLFDLDGQLAIFNAQVSESPSVCKPGTPLATPTSSGPTAVSSSAPVKRGVVKRKSRGKDGEGDGKGGGQRGTEGGSEQRSTKQRSPGHAGGEEGKKGRREKKKPRSGEKTKHHTGDGQGSDVDRDEDGGVLAVTGSTSMETGNDFRPGWITRPCEQDPVISSTSATQYTDAVGGAVAAKNETCFAQLQKRLADCLRSIRTSETTSLSGTQCLPGSETTTYHRSGSDKLQPCSVSPQKEVRINPNPEASTVERAQRSAELERVVRVSENPGGEIRIHLNQEDMSVMTDDRCQDTVMLCMEVHKELQADCPTEGELATSFNVEPRTLGAECLVTVRTELAVLSDSPVKADTSSPLETAVARMNPNQDPVSMSLPGAALETTVIRIHPRHTDKGLDNCRLHTTLDKDDSADDRIDPTLGDVGMEQLVQPAYDDPLYFGLHDEAMGEDVLKKSSDAVGDRFLYLSDDDKDTAHEDKKLRGEEVLLDIHGTLSTTQCDTVATEETQAVDVVDVDALCLETDRLKLPVADMEDFRHRDGDEFMPSPVIDADISNLSSFPVSLEHVVAASTRTGAPIVLGLPSVGFGDVEAKPGEHCLPLLASRSSSRS
ncbi:hypothetical protein CBR_g9006 [Chara braunii]|uniref:Uncharacterized protein n=1 Tax=Chara braunii TaxID=69332 RepID=A0A388KNF0_CHABU|nr:hypothetical protein CBR_g9006 [Chara braunii]|eukprot:GBG71590.1 hypothetical protein CBR_g9006 [Chara braunii]